MKRVYGYAVMAPEGGEGGGGGAAGGGAGSGGDGKGGAGGAAGGDGKSGEGKSAGAAGKAAGGEGKGKGGEGDPLLAGGGDGKGGDGASGSLLAGDDGAGGADKQKKEPAPADVKPEEIDAYLAKIEKIDLGGGDGGPAPAWDDGALKAVAPLFIRHKVGDAAANEIIAAYAKHVSGQYQAAAEADRSTLKALRDECGKRFGGDVKRFAAEGRRGGEHVFGKALFQRLARVEAFGSDPDIIEALAKIGRGLTTDGAAGGDRGEAAEKGLAERMYGKK